MSRSFLSRVALSALIVAGTACTDEPTDLQPPAGPTASQPAMSQRVDFDGRYIVTYKSTGGRAAAAQVAGQVALEIPSRRAVAVRLTEAQVNELRARGDIESIEPDARRYPMAETVPYGVTMVQADQVPPSGAGLIKVCIIDSGISGSHEDLATRPMNGTNNSGTGNWNEDTCGHGTHVAGTVAATAGNGLGVVGVAPDAVSLHIVKVFDGADCGWSYSSSLVAALDACRAAGARVVSMSLGGGAKSNFEQTAFASADAAGVLSVAAAGNDGNTRLSYPASYPSVVSVAAVDSAKALASFSQRNSAVDIAAPGVGVRSTYIFEASLTASAGTFNGSPIEFAALGTATGALVDGGLCDSVGSWAGKVVLCQRGTISFFDKVINAQNGGATGVAIYNNVAGGFAGTLGAGNSSNIPAISLSMEDGQALVAGSLGSSATLVSDHGDGYAELDGTSMATPHVSAVAALVWAQFPGKSNAEIRHALLASAEDLGAAGRDNSFGWGLVRAKAAYDRLVSGPVCKANGTSCTSAADCCSMNCAGKNVKTCK